jgi:hypothetical protein
MGDMQIGIAVPQTTPVTGLDSGPAPSPTPAAPDGIRGIRKNGRFAHHRFGPLHPVRTGAADVQQRSTTMGGDLGEGIVAGGLPAGIRKNGRFAFLHFGPMHPARTGAAGVQADVESGVDVGPPFGIRKNGRVMANHANIQKSTPSTFDVSPFRAHQYEHTDAIADAVAEAGRQDGMRRNGFDVEQA